MDWFAVLKATGIMAVLGVIFGALLTVASKKFAIKVDEKVAAIRSFLPGANCSGCGYPSCDAFAEACAKEEVEISRCAVIDADTLAKAAEALGTKVEKRVAMKATVLCQGTMKNSPPRYDYRGIHTCKAAALVASGNRGCRYACLGQGDCVNACPFGALSIGAGGIPVVDREKCTGCGVCTRVCPREVIGLLPETATTVVRCRTQDRGRKVREICKTGCITCRLCERACPNQAISCDTGVSKIDYEKCNGCMECVRKCPSKCITLTDPSLLNQLSESAIAALQSADA